MLDKNCVSCHKPDSTDKEAATLDLTPAKSYDNLLAYGKPSLRELVVAKHLNGRSLAGDSVAAKSQLLALLRAGHHDVKLDPDSFARLATWLDTYAQRLGSFSPEQEQQLTDLKKAWAYMLKE